MVLGASRTFVLAAIALAVVGLFAGVTLARDCHCNDGGGE